MRADSGSSTCHLPDVADEVVTQRSEPACRSGGPASSVALYRTRRQGRQEVKETQAGLTAGTERAGVRPVVAEGVGVGDAHGGERLFASA